MIGKAFGLQKVLPLPTCEGRYAVTMKKAVRFYLLLRFLSNLSQRRLNVRLFSYAALTLHVYYDRDRNVTMRITGLITAIESLAGDSVTPVH